MLKVIKSVYRSHWKGKAIEVKILKRAEVTEYCFYAIDSPNSVISLGSITVTPLIITDRTDNTRVGREIYESGLLWRELEPWHQR